MIQDKSLLFLNGALSTSGTGLASIGDVIDLRDLRDIGRGLPPLYLAIIVTVAVTSGGSATVSFVLASDSQQPVRTDGNQNSHYTSATIAKATLVAGYEIITPIPLELPAYARYLQLQQNVGTAALTAGSITAAIVLDPNAWKSYASAVYA